MVRMRNIVVAVSALAAVFAGTVSVGTAAAAVSCGQTITQNTILDADVGPCPGDGIVVGADNITLDLNGKRVFGTAERGDFAGIRLPNRSGVTVMGTPAVRGTRGVVTGFDAGVLINGGSANTVQRVIISDNRGPDTEETLLGDGIAIFYSANNRLLNNTVTANGGYDGIAVLGETSHGNLIQDNLVNDNVISPAFGGGLGIFVNAFLDVETGKLVHGNNIVRNTVRNNAAAGISTVNAQDARIAENLVEDNGFLSAPFGGIGATLGASPEARDGRLVIERNWIRGQYGHGLEFRSDRNVVRYNRIENNGVPVGFNGISFQGSNNIVDRNLVQRNPLGIELADDHAVGNRISNNKVIENPLLGILTWTMDGPNYVLNNYVVNNGFASDPVGWDLADAGEFVGFYEGCGPQVYSGNIYEFVQFQECPKANGTQVSVPNPAVAASASAAAEGGQSPVAAALSREQPALSPPAVRRSPAG